MRNSKYFKGLAEHAETEAEKTRYTQWASDARAEENEKRLKVLYPTIIVVSIIALVLLAFLIFSPKIANAEAIPAINSTPVPTVTPVITPEPTATPEPITDAALNSEINTFEELAMTLDEFGASTSHDERFAKGGTILDESLFEGDMIVGNAYYIEDSNGFNSQKRNVVFYYRAPEGGGRIRITGYDGQWFYIPNGTMTLNQAIAAMRETLIKAHGAEINYIQFYELFHYGDPVK